VTLPAVHIHEAESAADIDAVRELLQQYWTSFGFTPCFQNFAQELEGLPGLYARPSGCLLLARIDEQPAGCAAYRRIDAQHCEAKRLYVTPAARGHKLGRLLMERLIEEARTAGYQELLGDSLPVMKHALALYAAMGFTSTTLDSGVVLLRYKL
jgi:putative acetyltransferase